MTIISLSSLCGCGRRTGIRSRASLSRATPCCPCHLLLCGFDCTTLEFGLLTSCYPPLSMRANRSMCDQGYCEQSKTMSVSQDVNFVPACPIQLRTPEYFYSLLILFQLTYFGAIEKIMSLLLYILKSPINKIKNHNIIY